MVSKKLSKNKNTTSKTTEHTAEHKKISIQQIVILLTVVLSIFFGYEIGNRPFADPDEGRYVEIPREMVVTGDYVTPRLNGLKYFEKPPLFYWLQAASIKCCGITERSMRFWTAFFAIIGCLSVFGVGVACGSVSVGLISAGILATNFLYYALSHIIILDLVMSVLMSGVLWCFFLVFVARKRKESEESDESDAPRLLEFKPNKRKILIVLMYSLAALACLTKGLVGVVLPGFVGFLWLCFTRNWRWSILRELLYLPGIVAFLAIFLPWHLIVCDRNSDFFHFYFVVEHWLRYTTQIHKRYQPVWYFIPVILCGLLPWSGFCFSAIKNAIQKMTTGTKATKSIKATGAAAGAATAAPTHHLEDTFLLCWIFGIFGFYSFSNSKLIPYILPVFPPMAFITAKMLSKVDTASERNFRIGACINVVLLALFAAASIYFKDAVSDVSATFPEVITLVWAFAIILGVGALLLLYLVLFGKNKGIFNSLILYTFLAMNMLWVVNKAAPFYQAVKKPSAKDMAEIVRMNFNEKNGDEVYCHKRYQQDFPVYLQRTVGVTDHLGELCFGSKAEKNDRMISSEQLWERWKKNDKRIFVLMSRKEYQKFFLQNIPHILLHFDKNFVVIINNKQK